ncbi:SoxR reducing system RseC family protein [Clostridium sp.]|uniref:SoxR reducing system RseC family protein n=1 Tax=Clostridium sp. TaxID=1506 RepID=UPI002FC640FF
MEQKGVVKSVNGDVAKVAFIKKSGCGSGCSSCKSKCGPQDIIFVDVKNTQNAKIGDEVKVALQGKDFSKMTFWGYGFPTLITILTLVLGLFLFDSLSLANYELYAALLSLGAMAVSYKIGGIINKNKENSNYSLQMIEK